MSGVADDADPGWVDLAMTDASLVAELLVRLGHAQPPPPRASPPLKLAWSVRQRRTRQPPRNPAEKKEQEEEEKKEKGPRSRGSPTTPLSWSGATSSGGGGADGSEESPPLDSATRSKVSLASANTGSTTVAGKRPRKKKTLAELREEESLLLKERRNLRHELATLGLDLEKARSINQSLKRIKMGMQPQAVVPEQHEQVEAPCIPWEHTKVATQQQQRFSNIPEVKKVKSPERLELPDLNMPIEDGGPGISCVAA